MDSHNAQERPGETEFTTHRTHHTAHTRHGINALLFSLLTTGAISSLPASLPTLATPPTNTDKQQSKLIDITSPATLETLIRDLDNDKFTIRQRAQNTLQNIVGDWVRKHHSPFPLIDHLSPKKENYSLEQHRRLQDIQRTHEHALMEILWIPSRFAAPQAWKGRKNAPTGAEVIAELGQQAKETVTTDQEHILSTSVGQSLDQKTFWEVIEELRKATKGKLSPTRTRDGTLQLHHSVVQETHTRNGVFLGTIFQRHFAQEGQWVLPFSILSEDKILLSAFSVQKMLWKANNGMSGEIPIDAQEWHPGDASLTLSIPSLPGVKSLEISLTCTVIGSRCKTIPIQNPREQSTLKTNLCEMSFVGVHPTTERRTDRRVVWQVQTTLPCEWDQGQRVLAASRCKAFQKNGKPCTWYGNGSSSPPLRADWEFWEEPHTIEFRLPDETMLMEKTFHFENIPVR